MMKLTKIMHLACYFRSLLVVAAGIVLASSTCQADLADDFQKYFEARNELLIRGLAPNDFDGPAPRPEQPSCMTTMRCPVCKATGVIELSEPDLGQFEGRLKKGGRLQKYKCPLCQGSRKWQVYLEADDFERLPALGYERFKTLHLTKDDVAVGAGFVPRYIHDNMNKAEVKRAENEFGKPCKSCNWTGAVACRKCKGEGVVKCKEKGCQEGWIVQKSKSYGATLQSGKGRLDSSRKVGSQNEISVTRCPNCGGVAKVLCDECRGKCGSVCKKCKGLGLVKKQK